MRTSRPLSPALLIVLAVAGAQPAAAIDLGTNLDAVVDYSPQHVFVDAFKQSRTWITQTETTFDTGEDALLDLDADGWVRSFPVTGHTYDRVATLLFFSGNDAYPAGQYVVTYDGEGVLEYRFGVTVDSSVPGRDVLTVTPGGGIAIVLRSTNPANYLRNIRVWMPGFDELNGPAQLFHPEFLRLLQGYGTLRFMDWMQTNGSTQEDFADRPRLADARYTLEKGVPLEVMVQLANRMQANPWFTMPHRATDDYVAQFATLVRDTLDPALQVYVEYSNEVWNSGFSQGSYVETQGQANFPGGSATGFTKRMNQHGRRTAEICDLWHEVYGAQAGRLRCTLGAQAANTFTATEAADCPLWSEAPCSGHHLAAVAIAPYFGGYLGDPATQSTVDDFTLDQLFTEIEVGGVLGGGPPGGAIDQTKPWVSGYRAEATARNLSLVAYEGGQHLVGYFGAENNVALTDLLVAANRDARMGTAYDDYLDDSWVVGGGELFVHFTSAGSYSKFGSWGAVERLDQPATPKNLSLKAHADRLSRDGFESGSRSAWSSATP